MGRSDKALITSDFQKYRDRESRPLSARRSQMIAQAIRLSVLATTLVAMMAAQVGAQATMDPDWPCIQVLVPTISAAVVWDGPSIEGLEARWRDQVSVARLVGRVTQRHVDADQAEQEIDAFSQSQPTADRNAALTAVFAGIWEILNEKRQDMIERIKEFARQQSARANRIENMLLELEVVSSDSSPASSAQIATFRQDLILEVRIFEDREKSIIYLCELPVKIEGKMGALARAISAQLN